MITCRELTEFLDDYVAGALAASRRTLFDAHLAVCPDCRNYLASYRQAVEMVATTRHLEPTGVPEELVKAVMAVRRRNAAIGAGSGAPPKPRCR